MSRVVLQERQRTLLQDERRIVTELQACLAAFDGGDAHAATLRQITTSLDELFLLVVVGEFNAGKSACINALLRDVVLEEGVIPTTHQVTILRYGQQRTQVQQEGGVLELRYPADFLHDISIVDTPGVNAVLREHERLTEDFIPRSDLILFVASVDRPFTQSERVFMERIRAWGKKVVIVLNKIDLLRDPGALDQVMAFVRENCKHLLGFLPEIFPVSTLQAQLSCVAASSEAAHLWERSRFSALEDYLFSTLDEVERVRLKLLSPLGVMTRVLTTTQQSIEQRANLLAEDAHTVINIEDQLLLYSEDMTNNFQHRLGEIENIVLDMRGRGNRFFDSTIRLGRIFDLVRGERVREEFERYVIGDSAQRIDQSVQELIDWMVEHEHRLWQGVMEYLDRRQEISLRREGELVGSVSRQFDYNRRSLLQSVARTASNIVQTYDHAAEADELSDNLRGAAAQMAIAGVGGIGLGAAIVALVGTAAADLSGVLAGVALLGLGLYILPMKRKQVKQHFDAKMQELQAHLSSAMEEQFRKELNNSLTRVQDAIAPYTRFVRAEQKKAEAMRGQITHLNEALLSLRHEVETLCA